MDKIYINQQDKWFESYCDIFEIDEQKRKKINVMIVYLNHDDISKCYIELYDKEGIALR